MPAISVCYENANLGVNQCGKEAQATCTGERGLGECCSEGGWCGSDHTFCGEGMQVEFSHGKNLCVEGLSNEGPEQQAAAAPEAEKPENCLEDANEGASQCGAAIGATCTGSHGLGKCCSASGWCGNDAEFCGDDMQTEYSNGKNLCKAEASPDGEQEDETASSCLTLDQVAVAWVSGIAPINKDDAQQMCVPAVVIAAANTYNTPTCEDRFDPTVEAPGYNTMLKGLWQITEDVYWEDPKKQAVATYEVYTGRNDTFGCLAEWCSTTQVGCSEIIMDIGQDGNWIKDHRFCKGVWSGAVQQIPVKLEALGGMAVVQAACATAAKGIGAWAAVRSATHLQAMHTVMRPSKTADP